MAEELVRQTELMKLSSGVKPKPQEFANTLWAFATAGIRVEAHVKLATLMADTLDEGNGAFFDGSYFKPQELANSGMIYCKRVVVSLFQTSHHHLLFFYSLGSCHTSFQTNKQWCQ